MKGSFSMLFIKKIVFATMVSFLVHTASGQEEKNNSVKDNPISGKEENPNPTTMETWIKQLDHTQLTKREEAQRHLMKAGKAAIPSLAKAALSDKKEMIEKSIAILSKLAQSDDIATQEAAKGTLQMLSKSDQPSTAQRALLALNVKDGDGIKPFEGWEKMNNPFFMNQAGRGGNQSVSVSNINGRRLITVKEGDIETKIQDLDGGRISVRVTGGEKKEDFKVKNIQELKSKSPDAYAIYTRYAGNATGQGFGGGFNPNLKIIGNAGNANEMMLQQLEQLKNQFKDDPAMMQLIENQIKNHKK